MKTITISTILLLLSAGLYAQASLTAKGGTHIVCSGNPSIVLRDMGWNNEGAFSPGQSELSFIGTQANAASFSDDLFNPYHMVNIRRAGSELRLDSDIDLQGNIRFQSGLLNLNNQTATFLSAGRGLRHEDGSRYTYGPIGGQLLAGKILDFPEKENVGNLGAVFTAGGDLSYTEVRRGHGLYFTPGGHSISRWYQINSIGGAGVPTAIQFSYFEHELNGLDEGQLQVWHSADYGLSWTPVEVVSRSIAHNWVQIFGEGFGGLYTLALPGGSFVPGGAPLAEQPVLKPANAEKALHCYPNPVASQLNVTLEATKGQLLTLEWYDAAGHLVKAEPVEAVKGQNTFSFDLARLPAGTYFLGVQGAGQEAVPLVKLP